MLNISGYIIVSGSSFSPKKAEEVTRLTFEDKWEVGDIGTIGKYKNKPHDFGLFSVDLDFFEKSKNDFFSTTSSS